MPVVLGPIMIARTVTGRLVLTSRSVVALHPAQTIRPPNLPNSARPTKRCERKGLDKKVALRPPTVPTMARGNRIATGRDER